MINNEQLHQSLTKGVQKAVEKMLQDGSELNCVKNILHDYFADTGYYIAEGSQGTFHLLKTGDGMPFDVYDTYAEALKVLLDKVEVKQKEDEPDE